MFFAVVVNVIEDSLGHVMPTANDLYVNDSYHIDIVINLYSLGEEKRIPLSWLTSRGDFGRRSIWHSMKMEFLTRKSKSAKRRSNRRLSRVRPPTVRLRCV